MIFHFVSKNMSYKNSFKIGEDVDAISRATVSLSCICDTIRVSSRIMAGSVYNLSLPEMEVSYGFPWKRFIPVLVLCILTLVAVLTEWKLLRDLILLSVLVYLGWTWPRWLAMGDIIQFAGGSWPAGEVTLIWFLLLGTAFILTPIWGRVFCGYLCPFGAISEFTGRFLAWVRRPWRKPPLII